MKTIKKIKTGMFITLITLFLTSCSETISKEDHDAQIENLANIEHKRVDSIERNYIVTLDEIDGNLDAIRDKYGILVLGPNSNSDYGVVKKDQIINNISVINNLLAQNKNKINQLEKSLAKYKNGKQELIRSIEKAKQRIEDQDRIVEVMKTELLKSNYKIEELNKTVSEKNESIALLSTEREQQQKQFQKKYFAYGTSKELKQKNVIKPQKGIVAIAKTKQLNPNCNKDEFTSLNMYNNTELTLTGKHPKLLTSHPEGSYAFVSNNDNKTLLLINNPDKFWETSNYLVVQVK